jgi:hypothetical protein
MNRKRRNWLKILGVALALAVSGSIAGDYGAILLMEALAPAIRLFDGQWVEPLTADTAIVPTIIVFSAALVAFGLCLWAAQWLANRILSSKARMTRTEEEPKRVLIMGLSHLDSEKLEKLKDEGRSVRVEDVAKPVAEFNQLPQENRPTSTAWQQNIRSMYHHGNCLEQVIVLPSAESHGQFEAFKTYATDLFSSLRPNLHIDFVRSKDQAEKSFYILRGEHRIRSYEDYDYVREGLNRAIEQAVECKLLKKVQPQDICIDATAGQKIFSIAAAIITLNTAIKFSYVTTGPSQGGGEVRFYDASVEFAGFPG